MALSIAALRGVFSNRAARGTRQEEKAPPGRGLTVFFSSSRRLIAISQDPLAHIGRLVATSSVRSEENAAQAQAPAQAPAQALGQAARDVAQPLASSPRGAWSADNLVGVTDCVLDPAAVTPAQRWAVDNGTVVQQGPSKDSKPKP